MKTSTIILLSILGLAAAVGAYLLISHVSSQDKIAQAKADADAKAAAAAAAQQQAAAAAAAAKAAAAPAQSSGGGGGPLSGLLSAATGLLGLL